MHIDKRTLTVSLGLEDELLVKVQHGLNQEKQKIVVKQLLKVIKYCTDEEDKLSQSGVNLKVFGYVIDEVWKSIKTVVGMPTEESPKDFESGYWLNIAGKYASGEITSDEAVRKIIAWQEAGE